MTPQQRLQAIITEEKIRAFAPFGGTEPVVAFTETTTAGLEYLICEKEFEPWGIVFHKDVIYQMGGGPVWYVRHDLFESMQKDEQLRTWTVRTQPHGRGRSDWRHEREWRLLGEFPFTMLDVRAIIAPQSAFSEAHDVVEKAMDDLATNYGRRTIPCPAIWFWDPHRSRLWEHRRFRISRTLS